MTSSGRGLQIASLILYFLTCSGGQPWSVLPESTGDICPNTCIWKNRNVSTSNNICCKECSCDNDCNVDGYCCFKELDSPNSQRRCTATATIQSVAHQAFYMIDRNPTTGCIIPVEGMKKRHQCGKVNVAFGGSIYPVLSRSTGKIYRNEKCALCHNDTNYVTWMPIMICRKQGRLRHFIANTLEFTSVVADNCYFAFQLDGYDNILIKHECMLRPIDYCKKPSTFLVPSGLNLSRTDVMKACISGFRSQVEGFTNIFCWICSNEGNLLPTGCEFKSTIPRIMLSIMLIMDPEKIAHTCTRNVVQKQRCTLVNTKQGNSNACVKLLCPTGKTMIMSKCDYLANQWRLGKYTIILTLTPTDEQNETDSAMERVADFFHNQNTSTIKKSFQRPWKKHWTLRKIFHQETLIGNSTSVHLHIELHLSFDMVNPNKLIREIKNSLRSGLWRLKTGTETLRFSQELAKRHVIQSNDFNLPRCDLFTLLYLERTVGYLVPFCITKLFLCRQIELYQEEFTLARSEDVLYYKAKQDYLYQYEFDIIYSNGNLTARICISDSIYVISSSTIVSGSIFKSLFAVSVFQIAIFLYIQ